jgi:hypothetical protein
MSNLQQLLDSGIITPSQYNDMSSMELENSIPDFSKVWNPTVKAEAFKIWLKNLLANLLQKTIERTLLLTYPTSTFIPKLVKDPLPSALRKSTRGLTVGTGLFTKMFKTGLRSLVTSYTSCLVVDVSWMCCTDISAYLKSPPPTRPPLLPICKSLLRRTVLKSICKALQIIMSAAAGAAVAGITGNKVMKNLGYVMGDAAGGSAAGILGIMV